MSGLLTNSVQGHRHDDYWLPASELNSRFSNPLLLNSLMGNLLLVSLNGGKNEPAYPKIADNDNLIKTRTLGNWAIAPDRAQKIEFIVGVYRDLIRCVFRATRDQNGATCLTVIPAAKPRAMRRVRFDGHRDFDLETKWGLRRIVNSEGKILTKFGRMQACRIITGG